MTKNKKVKRCTKCNREKSVKLFHKNGSASDGLQSWCKSCRKKYDRTRGTHAATPKLAPVKGDEPRVSEEPLDNVVKITSSASALKTVLSNVQDMLKDGVSSDAVDTYISTAQDNPELLSAWIEIGAYFATKMSRKTATK